MGHIGYGPAAEDIRAERGLPYATGADEPPDWHNHPGTQACWADPLNRMERKELRLKLARAGRRFWDVADASSVRRGSLGCALLKASAEMADLHLDVTERAAVPA